ncbi:MAG: FtsW/RodA/SpoVE family cell cycle protein [Anaerolineaceae bacterium]|nr:FtsW/RodA/SpoVE family cell cycle protein [Anaerolineaceae bacterium]
MGESTFVKPRSSVTAPLNRVRNLRLGIDIPMVAVVLILFSFGALMVYSASWQYSYQAGLQPYDLILKQIGYGLLGIAMAVVISTIDYHRYSRWVVLGIIVTLIVLIAVLFTTGRRAFISGSIQPSEPAKLMILIYLAFWLYSKRDVLNQISLGLMPMGAILGLCAGLVLLQPDISAAITIFALGGLLFFLAGGDWKQILLVLIVAFALGFIIVKISPTAETRITDYISGLNDPSNASDHLKWSMQAMVNGGFFGVGIGKSTAKFAGLPVAPTDSIFAVIAEETGLLGASIVIILYIVFLWRGLSIANRAPDLLGKLLAGGITLWVVIEAVINMGVLVNLLPFAGNALPLISAGGSNLVVTFCGIGLIMSVARASNQNRSSKTDGRSYSAVVDLRRRDRRGRLPRSNRFTDTR